MKRITKSLKFYQNRFARIAPSHYLANIVAFLIGDPTRLMQQKYFFLRCLLTSTITNSWFSFGGLSCTAFNGPSWTISTLTMMYLVFPWIINLLQTLSDSGLSRAIVVLYYVQLLHLLFSAVFWDTYLMEHSDGPSA